MGRIVTEIERWARSKTLSIDAALKELSISTNVFYRWKNGGQPRMATAKRVAAQLGVEVESVLDPVDTSEAIAQAKVSPRSHRTSEEMVLVAFPRSLYDECAGALAKLGGTAFLRAGIGPEVHLNPRL